MAGGARCHHPHDASLTSVVGCWEVWYTFDSNRLESQNHRYLVIQIIVTTCMPRRIIAELDGQQSLCWADTAIKLQWVPHPDCKSGLEARLRWSGVDRPCHRPSAILRIQVAST